jgi:hypothetical protein
MTHIVQETLSFDTTTRSIPRFLTESAPTRYRHAIVPFSRVPATAHLGEVWHVAAQRADGQRVIVDHPADIDPNGPTGRSYGGWAELIGRVRRLESR